MEADKGLLGVEREDLSTEARAADRRLGPERAPGKGRMKAVLSVCESGAATMTSDVALCLPATSSNPALSASLFEVTSPDLVTRAAPLDGGAPAAPENPKREAAPEGPAEGALLEVEGRGSVDDGAPRAVLRVAPRATPSRLGGRRSMLK